MRHDTQIPNLRTGANGAARHGAGSSSHGEGRAGAAAGGSAAGGLAGVAVQLVTGGVDSEHSMQMEAGQCRKV